jgi:predicted peptidase
MKSRFPLYDRRSGSAAGRMGLAARPSAPDRWRGFSRGWRRVAVAVLLVFCLPMKAPARSATNALMAETLKWKVSRVMKLQYLVYRPKDYDPRSGRRWPLMLFLHGSGERGTNVQKVAVHGPLKLVQQGRDFPFLIVAPQCPAGQDWSNESLLVLLDHVTKAYAVDPRRVYLTGLSMGGYGTWRLGLTHPEKFAAIAPICGGGALIDAILGGRARAALRSLPVWAFHGAKDTVVPLDESERMVNALKKLGDPEVKLTVYPDAGHDSWTETYNNPELYEWLLKHSR